MNELMTTEQALARAQMLDCFTPVGLDIQTHLGAKDYYAIAIQIKMMGDAAGYARADLAYRLKVIYPNEYKTQWAELANLLGKVPPTIANDALVGQRYSHDERLYWMENGLSYSHLRIASAIEDGNRRYAVLLDCVREGWSVHQLSRFLFGDRPLLPPPSRDAPPIRERVGGWLDTLNESDRGYAEYYVKLFVDWLEG